MLWVDAVRINQADIEERNQQVALMRNVYTNAFQVVPWLREEYRYDSQAMDFRDLKPIASHGLDQDQIIRVMCLQAKLATALIYANVLLQRPWFSRAWIIQ